MTQSQIKKPFLINTFALKYKCTLTKGTYVKSLLLIIFLSYLPSSYGAIGNEYVLGPLKQIRTALSKIPIRSFRRHGFSFVSATKNGTKGYNVVLKKRDDETCKIQLGIAKSDDGPQRVGPIKTPNLKITKQSCY